MCLPLKNYKRDYKLGVTPHHLDYGKVDQHVKWKKEKTKS